MTLPPARWYFDADTIGTGKVLSRARSDVTWPGDTGQRQGPARKWLPPSPIETTDVDDDEWIPKVTAAGMTIVTRDHRIQTRLTERQAVYRSGAKMFAIAQQGQLNGWELLEVVVTRWRDMEEIATANRGPFIYSVTRGAKPRQVFP